MITSNVPTIKGGALNPISVQKMKRISQIAKQNRLPVISMIQTVRILNLLQFIL